MCRKDWPSKVHLLRNLVRYSTKDLLHCTHTEIVFNKLLCKNESDSLRFERLEMIPALQGSVCDDDHEIAPAHHVYLFVGRPAVKTKLSAWSSK
ncbi:hypothetical protein T09_8748 [Trichinella sp. T9]|nr:hypothetical protein T09_8748 [Trichinella sp. T9]